jgi:hypothetical protein
MSKFAGVLAIVGGAMLVIGGFSGTGASTLGSVKGMVEKWMPANDMKDNVILVLTIMIFMALLGGFSVIIGGYLMWKGMDMAGKILVWLGTGVGLMSLVISGIIAYATGKWDMFVASNMTFIGIGLVLSIVARRIA